MAMSYTELRSIQKLKTPFLPLTKIRLEGSEICFGRSLENKINVPFVGISRHHCIFKQSDNVWTVQDTSSVGICINEKKIPKYVDHVLKNFDVITFDACGEFKYCFLQTNAKNCDSDIEKTKTNMLNCDKKLDEQLLIEKNELINKLEKEKLEAESKLEHEKNLIIIEQEKKNELIKNTENAIEELKAGLKKKNDEIIKLNKQIKNNNLKISTLTRKKRKLDEIESNEATVVQKVYNEFLDRELICLVCHEPFYKSLILNCGHTYCDFCLRQWEAKSDVCPVCRTVITSRCENFIINSVVEKMVLNLDEDCQNRRKKLIKYREEKTNKKSYNLRKRR